ncbi:hypothetical protein [Radiobacillus sp. PE A8.2]
MIRVSVDVGGGMTSGVSGTGSEWNRGSDLLLQSMRIIHKGDDKPDPVFQ